MGVGSLQRVKPSGKLQVRTGETALRREDADCVDAGLEMGIIREVEVQ